MDRFLAQLLIFRTIAPQARESLFRLFMLRRHAADDLIFEEGQPADAVYLLRTGLVKVVKYSPRTEPNTMELIVPGGLFGMVAVLDQKPYPVSAVSFSRSEIYRIPQAVFSDLLKSNAAFSQEVFRHMGDHLRHAQVMRAIHQEPVEKRTAYMLWVLSERVGRELLVTREDIAEMVGTTSETAIRTLAGFRKKNLISAGWKKIDVLDSAGLKALSGVE